MIPTLAWTALTVASCSLGVLGIAWSRDRREPTRVRWGQRLVVGSLVALGAVSLVAAFDPHSLVQYFGLAVAWLVIGLVWEGPAMQPKEPLRLDDLHA